MIPLLLALAASSAPVVSPSPASDALIGKPAADFNLPSDRGGTVRLKDFKGKQPVLLAFFPKAFTPG